MILSDKWHATEGKTEILSESKVSTGVGLLLLVGFLDLVWFFFFFFNFLRIESIHPSHNHWSLAD